ncbi:MAG: hydroxyacid dehydrogenase, partial [Methyloligellaceae bacterium]
MAKILIAEEMYREAVAELKSGYDVHFDPDLWKKPEDLAAQVQTADALIVRNQTQVTRELVGRAGKLKVVGRLGVGLDNIDLDACAAANVTVCPATGANAVSVAEYVLTTAMILVRGAYGATHRVIDGEWPRFDLVGREIFEKSLGIVGLGSIGQTVAEKTKALGLSVRAYDPLLADDDPAWNGIKRMQLDELAATSDILTFQVPLIDATRNLVDAAFIGRMKASAILINTARGGIVDEAGVVEALERGHLGGAALDVFAEEPLGKDAGQIFADVKNLILTPHISGVTSDSNRRVSFVTAENVRQGLVRHSTN